MFQDIRYAFRQFSKSPGFTAVVVLSLALGIGANTTVLCWLQKFVLRSLPGVSEPSRLVVIVSNTGGGNASLPDLRDFGRLDTVFSGTLATMSTQACLTIGRRTRWIEAQVVTANFFDLLGVAPLLGRTFRNGEDQTPGGDNLLVISERLWRAEFEADPSIIGKTVDLNRKPFTIIGVVPAGFRGTINPILSDAWAPASMIAEVRNQGRGFLTQRDARGWHNLARLQPGITVEQAHAAVTTANARLAIEYAQTNRDAQHKVLPLNRCPWGAQTVMGPALGLLLAVSLGVQLIVTANVANLMLARATGRRKEIAVRLSTGATRGRLIRQLLTESLFYAFAGGALGVFFAWQSAGSLVLFLPEELAARTQLEFSLDGVSLLLTLALTLVTGVLFGIVPALQATRPDLVNALKEGGRTASAGSANHRLRNTLVAVEIAIALSLLVGAGLCIKGLGQARRVDVGFDANHVLIGKMQIGMNGYDRSNGPAFYRTLREQVAALPGVEEAAFASWLPLGMAGCKGTGVFVEGYARPRGEDNNYEFAIISPRYFATLRIPLVGGRDFTDADDTNATPVAIVNEHFARRFWPGQDPLGRRFRAAGQWRTVVGVAKAGKYNRVEEQADCFLYLPYQQGVPDLDLSLCVRTSGEPAAFAGTLREAVQRLDPGVELLDTLTLKAYSGMALFPQLMATSLLILLGGVALLLSAMGVYAVMAYTVGQRMQEFGIRMALGASPVQVQSLVLAQGLKLACLGVATGLVASAGLTRLLSNFLHGVHPFDPTVLGITAMLLTGIALLACWLPAWRATLVNPVTALRSE